MGGDIPTVPRTAAEVEGATQSPSLSTGLAPGEGPHSQGREPGRAGSRALLSLGKGSSKKHVLKPLLLRKGSVC